MNATLLHIVGTDRDDKVAVRGRQVKISGSTDLHKLLDEPHHRLHVTPQILRQARRPDLDGYSCLMNLITEPEHSQRVLDNLRKLLRGVPGKVINRPEAVLASTRDQVARRLSGIPGLLAPKVVRLRATKPAVTRQMVERAGLRFPVILRETGTHSGRIVGLFDDVEDMVAGLVERGEYIATEFIDFRSPDGLYRKYRVFFIGKQLIFRHLIASDAWNIHASDRRRYMIERPELLAEEEPMFARPEGAFPEPVLNTLRTVRERMKLDFFGMDFGLLPDGRVLLFEANASMNFFPFRAEPQFAYLKQCLEPARRAFRELVGLEQSPLLSKPA